MKYDLKNVTSISIERSDDDGTVTATAYGRDPYYPAYVIVIKRASAKCGPNDIYDFNIGAKLAMDRLYEGYDMTPKPKRKPYNGLIYIHEYPGRGLAEGALYRVKDGKIQNCWYHSSPHGEPYIFNDMSDDMLSSVIRTDLYGTYGKVEAHFIRNDKTKA